MHITQRAPLCPNCGDAMRLTRTIQRLSNLPELRIFECKPCGVIFTDAVEAEILEIAAL
jgi:hypothetical protein